MVRVLVAVLLEVELKLTVAVDQTDRLYDNSFLAKHSTGPRAPQCLVSVYYDTPDRCLWQHGLSLRIREDQGRFIQTLKTVGQQIGAVHHRHEWDQTIPNASPAAAYFANAKLQAKLEKLLNNQPLLPLFKTEFIRTQWDIYLAEGSQIELVLDQGTVSNASQSVPLHEIELELKCGQTDTLYTVADILRQSMALTVEHRSKAERGYLLCS